VTDSVAQEAAGAERGQIIAPGSTIGILGGGQLGRMTALAAARLGYRVHSYCPEADSPAFQVSAAATTAAYDDRDALARFAGSVDVITFEFENVPSATAELLAAMKPTRPRPQLASDSAKCKIFSTGTRGARSAPACASRPWT